MGLFSGMYKPKENVKEITTENQNSPAIVKFFVILSRKIFQLIQLNIVYIISNIIIFPLLYFFFTPIIFRYDLIYQGLYPESYFTDLPIQNQAFWHSSFALLSTFFMCFPLIVFGPAQAGFSFVCRNFVQEKHTWIFSDFITHLRNNFRQGFTICLINMAVMYFMSQSLTYYIINYFIKYDIISFILMIFLAACLIVFLMMSMYIYPLLVTFKLSIKQIYKNAATFALIRSPLNLLVLIINLFIFGLLLMFTTPIVFIILFIFILPAFSGYMSHFVAYPVIRKYMVDVIERRNVKKGLQ